MRAISVKTGATAWNYTQRTGVMAVVATGGGLVFGGDATGGFRALDAKTGEVKWQTQLGGAVSGIPISYAVGGKQFVAVTTGTSPESGGLAHDAGGQGGKRAHAARVRVELTSIWTTVRSGRCL